MIDVLVSPGAPEPWLIQQKETAALNPVLSSKEVLFRLSLNNFLFIHDSPLQSSVHCPSTVDSAKGGHHYSQPYRKRRQLHWQNSPTMDTQTQCLSSTIADSDMASWQGSLAHDYGCREKIISHEAPTSSSSFQNQYTSNAYRLTAPIMKTTNSSSGIPVSVQTAPGSVDSPRKVFTTVKMDGSQDQSMAGSEPNWLSETPPSFGSGTESSPSLSSSFEFLEVPKEDTVPYGLLLSDGAFMDHQPNKALVSESQYTPFLENSLSTTSFQWSMSTGNDSWHSQYPSDALAWSAPTAMTSSSWPMPEHAGIIPDTQLVAPYNYTHNSLLSPHNNTSIPSVPMPDEPNYSPVNSLGMGTSQTHSFNNPPRYSGLPSMPNYSTSFPGLGSSRAYPELLQQQLENPAIKANLHYSDTRDAQLIEWKRAGLSYKEIKRIGGFKEAESTLRGRFRTLTKAKEHRVRKPKWLKRDVSILYPNSCSNWSAR